MVGGEHGARQPSAEEPRRTNHASGRAPGQAATFRVVGAVVSGSVAAGGAGRPWVGCFERHGGAGWLCIPAHRFGYRLRYGVEALEVTRCSDADAAPRCVKASVPTTCRPGRPRGRRSPAAPGHRSNGGLDDAGAKAAHLGVQMLLFERLEDGPRPAGLEPGQAPR